MWFLRFLTPTNLVIAAVLALAAFAWFEHSEVQAMKPIIAHHELVIKKQESNIEVLNKDALIQEKFQKDKNNTTNRQQKFNEAQSKIPNTTTDHPFSNVDLFNAASQLRDYQQNSFPDPGNSTDTSRR
jgi:hypothetical protein